MMMKEKRNRIIELVNNINDETPYEVIMSIYKDMLSISIYVRPIKEDDIMSEHFNMFSLIFDNERTINNEISILETYHRHGLKASGVTA